VNTDFPNTLLLWLDGADGSSITGTSTVTQWNDKSGNGHHATVSSVGTTSPSLTTGAQNGLSALTIAGNGNKFFNSSIGVSTPSYTAFMVMKYTTKTNNALLWVTDDTWTSTSVGMSTNFTSQYQYILNGSSNYNTFLTPTAGTWYVVSIVDYGSNARIYANGVHIGSANSLVTTNRNLSVLDIGGWSGDATRTLNGQIGEVQVYSGAMTDANRQSIEYYLGQKWALPVDIRYGYNLDQWTIELYAYPTSFTNNGTIVCGISKTSNVYEGFQLQNQGASNTLVCWLNSQPTNSTTSDIANNVVGTGPSQLGTLPIIQGQWNHILVSFTGSAYVMYLNGALSGIVNTTMKISSNAWNSIVVGSTFTNSINGYVDGLRISKVSRAPSIPQSLSEHITIDKMDIVSNLFENSTIADGEYACPRVPVTSYTLVGTPLITYSNYKFGSSSMVVDNGSYVQINGLVIPSAWTIELWFQLRTLYPSTIFKNDNIELRVTSTSVSLAVSNTFGMRGRILLSSLQGLITSSSSMVVCSDLLKRVRMS
jgi:hypothetical protein